MEVQEENPGLNTWRFEATPIMVRGILYTSTSLNQVAAIDATTGKTRWVFDPESYRGVSPPNFGFVHRGVAYWADGEDARILIGTADDYLIALDAKNGHRFPHSGKTGASI